MEIKIAPSILAADVARLGDEVRDVMTGGADLIHVDVMDGLFVPNLSFGVPVVESLRKVTDAFLDVHLMVVRPERYVTAFCKAGADLVTFHLESTQPQYLYEALDAVRAQGKKVGLVLKPKTPAQLVFPFLATLDMILVMTVEPGFGRQHFMSEMLSKLRELRGMLDKVNPKCLLEVDGGIDINTAPLAAGAGAEVLVSGSAVFGKSDRAAAIRTIRDACGG